MQRNFSNRTSLTASVLASVIALAMGACSAPDKKPKVYAAGEKATVGPLSYSVIDTQLAQQLGEDMTTWRTPQNRFYLVRISVSNSSNAPVPIPSLALIDDTGKTWPELSDGNKVPEWLGVVRRVAPAQTESGNIVFDAPPQHYKLKVSDDLDPMEIAIDIPLTFVNEQMRNSQIRTPTDTAAPPAKK